MEFPYEHKMNFWAHFLQCFHELLALLIRDIWYHSYSDLYLQNMEICLQIDEIKFSIHTIISYIDVGNFFVFPVKNVPYRKVGWTCSVSNFYAPKIPIQNQILKFDLSWHDLNTNNSLLEFHFFCQLAILCVHNDVIFLTRHTWGQDSLEFYEEGADFRNAFTKWIQTRYIGKIPSTMTKAELETL